MRAARGFLILDGSGNRELAESLRLAVRIVSLRIGRDSTLSSIEFESPGCSIICLPPTLRGYFSFLAAGFCRMLARPVHRLGCGQIAAAAKDPNHDGNVSACCFQFGLSRVVDDRRNRR